MYIWKLERSEADHDEMSGLVLVAETESDARQIAHDGSRGDQSPDAWFAPTTTVTAIGEALPGLESGTVILTDFLEG
jgi:hypothetical protein